MYVAGLYLEYSGGILEDGLIMIIASVAVVGDLIGYCAMPLDQNKPLERLEPE